MPGRALACEICSSWISRAGAAGPDEAMHVAAAHRAVGPPGRDHLMLNASHAGASGRELADQLSPRRGDMKVLYMSGYTDHAVVHHGVLDPGLAYMAKPFTPEELARKVRAVLDGEPIA